MLQFLAPLFFAALAALAVPVLIHLIQRERKEALQFPSLMFLRQVPYKSVRRRRIRHWLLFLMRCAALILLIAAFARPFMERGAAAVSALDASREVVVLLDRSYSMGYGDRWQRAVTAAAAAVNGLSAQDRATIVYFDASATAAGQTTSDKVRLQAALDTVNVGSGGTRYGPALKLAQGILEGSELARGEVVLISDFQRAGWDGDAGARLPAGTTLRPVTVNDAETANVAVTDVVFRRERVSGRERVTATARVTNQSASAAESLPVSLELDGREVSTVSVNVAAKDVASVVFPPVTLPERETRGTVTAGSDALTADNRFHFVLSPRQSISVLIVDGEDETRSLYLRRALALAERPSYRVDAMTSGRLRAGALEGHNVVVLNDAVFPGGETGRLLRDFVERGGGLILALGERAGANGWGAGADLLPGSPDRLVDRVTGGGATLGYVDYAHPVFELFRAPRSGDFATARFFRYRPVTRAADSAAVLARYDDGAAALIERRLGVGRVMVWASSFDTDWNNFALQPVFLPFLHNLVRHAGGYAEPNAWFTVGQVLDVARLDTTSAPEPRDTAAAAQVSDIVVQLPSGARVRPGRGGLVRLDEQGFYEVRRPGERAVRLIAVNLDLAESDLTSLDAREIASAVEAGADAGSRTRMAGAIPIEERERRQALWWYLLVAALLLLAAESAVANRLSRRRRAEPSRSR